MAKHGVQVAIWELDDVGLGVGRPRGRHCDVSSESERTAPVGARQEARPKRAGVARELRIELHEDGAIGQLNGVTAEPTEAAIRDFRDDDRGRKHAPGRPIVSGLVAAERERRCRSDRHERRWHEAEAQHPPVVKLQRKGRWRHHAHALWPEAHRAII